MRETSCQDSLNGRRPRNWLNVEPASRRRWKGNGSVAQSWQTLNGYLSYGHQRRPVAMRRADGQAQS